MTRHAVFLSSVFLFCLIGFGEECDCGDGADLGHGKRRPGQKAEMVQALAALPLAAKRRQESNFSNGWCNVLFGSRFGGLGGQGGWSLEGRTCRQVELR